ncbi:mfs transporter [Ophiostoma piceae UAMH 11346]|uniref:Mfs transporter n=1 Tax=Ophiostoma piceae (strain UAMH 11346) TaxID=1262450 RepID=S3BVZ5_OPHP1|nr:mfs transporter [Ophiostoma piceae UAMH 11346]
MADRPTDSDTAVSVSAPAAEVHAAGTTPDDEPTAMDGGTVEMVGNKAVFKPTRSFYLAFSALLVLTIAVALDATTLSVALPTISSALGGSALEAFWSGTSFLLASTVLQPSVAALSNIFGRKYMIYLMVIFFAAGSLIGALAGNFTVLIAGRTIQGVGGGGIIALTEVVVTDLVPLQFRPAWFSTLSAMWSIGTVTGPLIGAGFAQNVTWRWIFYINLPLIGAGLAFVVLFLHQAKIPGGIVQKLGRFDWIGSILFTAASTSFLYGLTTGGVSHPWGSYQVLLPLIIGPIAIIVFGYYEFHWAEEPIINKRIFNNRDMLLTYVITVLHGHVLWSILYFLPLYYQGVLGYKPIISAVAILPETLTVAPAAGAVGVIAGMTGHYRWSLWVGWFLTTLGSGLLLLLKPDTSVAAWIWLNVPVGLGTGMLFPAMGLSVQAACEPVLNAQASAFYSFLRTFGQSIGVAISGVIFQNMFQKKLLRIPAFASVAAEYSRDATSIIYVIKAMPDSADKTSLVKAYNDSLHTIYISMLAFSAFCLVLTFFIKGYSLNQEHVTNQGLIDKAKDKEDAAAQSDGANAEKLALGS